MGRAFEYRRGAKEKRWDKMSKLFPKLGKSITAAAKEGGEDPDMNPRLRTAISNAKAENMPKDKIEAAISRASGKDAVDIIEVTFEGKGPHGVLVIVECATDNNTRSVANVKSYFNKMDGEMVTTGQFDFMFSRKAVFEIERNEEFTMDPEELELELIDAGLEDMELSDEIVTIYGDYTDFGTLSSKFDELGVKVFKADLQRIPNTTVEFTDEQLDDIEKLIDRIEDDEDVQAVYTNIA